MIVYVEDGRLNALYVDSEDHVIRYTVQSRGDREVWEDWRRFGLADAIDAVASSHSVGWRKPHPAIFQRALDLTGARAEETVMVGDRLDADVAGAQALGMRAVLRRTAYTAPQHAGHVRRPLSFRQSSSYGWRRYHRGLDPRVLAPHLRMSLGRLGRRLPI